MLVKGEHWSGELEAGSVETLDTGLTVEVVAVDGLHLTVKPASSEVSREDKN